MWGTQKKAVKNPQINHKYLFLHILHEHTTMKKIAKDIIALT